MASTDVNDIRITVDEQLAELKRLLEGAKEFSMGMAALTIQTDMHIQTYNKLSSSFGKIQ